VAECARNVSCVGGEPLGLTDCLNFGNPEKPEIMWQFAEATRGLAAACRELDVPVVSGNVSLYNETDGRAVLPTPTVGIVGLLPDVTKRCGASFQREGDLIALLGETRGILGGSEWLLAAHGKLAGLPPRLNAKAELALQQTVRALVRAGRLQSAHDCSEGGLAVALAESCMMNGEAPLGARVTLATGAVPPHAFLFGEDASRIVVSLRPEEREAVAAEAARAGVPFRFIGTVGGPSLQVQGLLDVPVVSLSKAWREALPALFR